MAEALGRLCHAASSRTKSSRPASPRGTPHPHPHPTSTSGSSSSVHHAAHADAVKGLHTAIGPVSSTHRHDPLVHPAPDSNAAAVGGANTAAAAGAAGEDEQLQISASDEEVQGSAKGDQPHRNEEGKGMPTTASGVEEGAAGGTGAASMLAALQRLDAQPATSELRSESQAESSMHSSEAIQQGSNTQHQAMPGRLGQSEGEQPSVHSSGAQEPAAATAVAAESEEQAGSGRAGASGSPTAASAEGPAIPSLVMSQVSGPLLRVYIPLQNNGAHHCSKNNKQHNIDLDSTVNTCLQRGLQ